MIGRLGMGDFLLKALRVRFGFGLEALEIFLLLIFDLI